MINQEFKLTSQSNSWIRIGKLAKDKQVVFKNLFQHFNVENLRQAYAAMDGTKAVGIDRITKDQYGKHLIGRGIYVSIELKSNFEEPVALIGHGGFCEELASSRRKR